MEEITIYHQGECSKCRGALELLQEKGIPHTVRWYLSEPLTEAELRSLLDKLQLPAFDLVRQSEPVYKEVYEGKVLDNEGWIRVLLDNPQLMQRPIVERGNKAIIARPPEKLLTFL